MGEGHMELEERTGAWHAEKEREKEAELTNLRYEVASAKRQITALQNTLSSKNREAAALRDALIARDVLLEEAACCIGDALALCREQLAQMDRASRLYMSYEMEWQSISARLSKMKDRLPEIPAAQEPAEGGKALESVRNRVGSRMEAAEESLRRMFEE